MLKTLRNLDLSGPGRAIAAFGLALVGDLSAVYERTFRWQHLRESQRELVFFGGALEAPLKQSLAVAAREAKSAVGLLVATGTPETEGATGNGFGTGFVVESDGTFLTARHNVVGRKTVNVLLEGRHYKVRLLGEDNDLALLRLVPHTKEPEAAELELPFLTLIDAPLKPGQPVVALGFPLEPKYQVSPGELLPELYQEPGPNGSGAWMNCLIFSLLTSTGASGGPVVAAGGVAGLVVAVIRNRMEALAVGSKELRQFLAAQRDKEGEELPALELDE